jgi:hypothetical protein
MMHHHPRRLALAILFMALLGPIAAMAAPPCPDMIMPVPDLKAVGRGFVSGGHSGIDLLAPQGSPVRATAAGTVVFAGRFSGYGNMVDVLHPEGAVTRYAHLSAFAPGLHPGSLVGAGGLLGKVGATGHATTPHLHFEVRIGGHAIDPKPALALVACQRPPVAREAIEEARAPEVGRGGWAK